MIRIHLTTLGGLRIEREGEEIRDLPAQPVRCALSLYLALERGATRDELAALLWPERDADRARHSLSQTLYELRRQLGSGRGQLDLAGFNERPEELPKLLHRRLRKLGAEVTKARNMGPANGLPYLALRRERRPGLGAILLS